MNRLFRMIKEAFLAFKERLYMLVSEEDGMGTVEVVLIIVVLVGLVLIFKSQIGEIVSGIFETIQSNVELVGE